jgi:hypothetical protein
VNYGELIGEAFSIVWRNRFLWFFGFFLGGANIVSPTNFGDFGTPTTGEPAWALNPGRWIENNVGLAILVLALTILAIMLVYLALFTLCRTVLTESVGAIACGEGRRFVSTFHAGLSVFPRTLGLVVIFSALCVLLLLIAGGSLLFLFLISSPGPLSSQIVSVFDALTLAALLVFVIFIPLGIVGQLAVRDAVVGGERVFASIGNGYRLFRRNLGKGVLLLVFAGKSVGIGALVFSGVVFMLLSVVLLAAISTFNHAYWTLAYLRLVALPTGPLSTAGQDGQTND